MSWLEALRKKQAAKKAVRERVEAANALRWDYVDRAPGWLDKGQTFSTVFPPGLEPDPAIVAAIRQFCPDYVPLWSRWVFSAPYDASHAGEEVVFGRHVIARFIEGPTVTKHDFPGLAPGVANYMEKLLCGASEKAGETDLPGAFVPLDWAMVERLRQEYGCFVNLTPNEYAEKLVVSPLEARTRAATYAALQRLGATEEVNKWFQKQIDNMSEVDMKNYALHGPQKKAKKPFVGAAYDTPSRILEGA